MPRNYFDDFQQQQQPIRPAFEPISVEEVSLPSQITANDVRVDPAEKLFGRKTSWAIEAPLEELNIPKSKPEPKQTLQPKARSKSAVSIAKVPKRTGTQPGSVVVPPTPASRPLNVFSGNLADARNSLDFRTVTPLKEAERITEKVWGESKPKNSSFDISGNKKGRVLPKVNGLSVENAPGEQRRLESEAFLDRLDQDERDQRIERNRATEKSKLAQKAVAPGGFKEFKNRVARGALSIPTSIAQGVGAMSGALPAEIVEQDLAPVEGFINRAFPVDPTDEGFLTAKLPEAAGTAGAFAATGGLSGVTGIGARLGSAMAGAASGAGTAYQEARSSGKSPEESVGLLGVSPLVGSLEGVMGGEASVGKTVRGGFRAIGREFKDEAIQEGTSELLGDVDAKYSGRDPMRDIGKTTPEAMALGGILGAGMAAPHVAIEKLRQRNSPHVSMVEAIEQTLQTQPDHPMLKALEMAGIHAQEVKLADDRALDELSKRLEAVTQVQSKIQQLQGQQQELLPSQQSAQAKQMMGQVPSPIEQQNAQAGVVVEQQLVQAQQQEQALVQDIQKNVSPFFKNLAKATGVQPQTETIGDVTDDAQGDLLTEIRRAGGMSAPEGAVEKGELDRLGPKESGTTGLISRKGGESPDQMRERMASEGLTRAETPQEFISEVEQQTKASKTEQEPYEDYQRSQMTPEEQAESDKLNELLSDTGSKFTQTYRALDNPRTIYTKKLAQTFVEEADAAGMSPEWIENTLAEAQQRRGLVPRESENVDDGAVGNRGTASSGLAESDRPVTKPGAPGVSMSPYKVIEANNKDLLKRLYDVNLNSDEGKAGIKTLRDYARANNIPQRHVDAHISDIANWQKRYGVPANPQAQSSSPRNDAKAPQPASKPTFSQSQRELLGVDHLSLADEQFDEYLSKLENLQNEFVRSETSTPGENRGLVAKLIETRKERSARVKAGRLKALNQPAKPAGPKLTKKEIGERMVEQERERKAKEAELLQPGQRTTEENQTELESKLRGEEKIMQDQAKAMDALFESLDRPDVEKQWTRKDVQQAIQEGKSDDVPERVLTQFPDLYDEVIGVKANKAATSPTNDLPEPTEAQIEAGNYKKGHINVQGLDVTVENPKGSTRSGKDRNGKEWSVKMTAHYGYIRRTVGADEEQVDVYVGDSPASDVAFVVDQIDPKTGKFDEHKVILGANTIEEAKALYDAHFDDKSGPARRGAITTMPVNKFKEWLKTEDNTKPVTYRETAAKTDGKTIGEKVLPRGAGRQEGEAESTPKVTASPRVISDFDSMFEELRDEEFAPESGFKPAQAIQLVADSVDKIRKDDVYRLFDETPQENRAALRDYIIENRKDLSKEVVEVIRELEEEAYNAQAAVKTPQKAPVAKQQTQPAAKKQDPKAKLMALFGDKPVKPGPAASLASPVFDDALYAQAKPVFDEVIAGAEPGLSDKEVMRLLFRDMKAEYGDAALTVIDRMKPYIIRFMEDRAKEVIDERQTDSEKLADEQSGPDGTGSVEAGATDESASGVKPETGAKPGSSVTGNGPRNGRLRKPKAKKQTSDALLFEGESESSAGDAAIEKVEAENQDLNAGEAVIQASVEGVEAEPEPAVEPPTPKPPKPTRNTRRPVSILTGASFTIGPDTISKITSGGAITKYKQNVDAIRTMRQVLAEGRKPTLEEQETMALYAGFGGIKPLFAASEYRQPMEPKERRMWFERQTELKELIGKEAYVSAERSTKNAHFTDPAIVSRMWGIAERLGFKGGKAVEPSVGIGNFLGLMPEGLRAKTSVTGVELDLTTGEMVRMLYPEANIHIQGFEEFNAPDDFFDLFIGNVPFGDYRISDNRYNRFLPQVHNYFFLKAVDKVRPGGLVMFITSTGTMDSNRATGIRKALYEKADLVEAIRLPAETFGKTALTSVVTDLIILRKRMPGETPKSDQWVNSQKVDDPRGKQHPQFWLNDYLAANPAQMLGNYNGENRMYPGRANLDRTDDFEQRFTDAVDRLPTGIMKDFSAGVRTEMKAAGAKVKTGGYVVKDGRLLQASDKGGLQEIPDASESRIRRVEGMLKIRDVFDDLIDGEMGRKPLGTARKDLNSAYDSFVAKYGPISDKKNADSMSGDPDYYRLAALEDYDSKKKIAKKRPIFTKSTVVGSRAKAKPENVTDALMKSFESRGEIIVPMMAEDLGVSVEMVADELTSRKIAFQAPNGQWQLAAHYLSGNVRRKLAEAKVAAATDSFFQANVDALSEVVPYDVPHTNISVEMGAPWMTPKVIEKFINQLFGETEGVVKVHYDRNLGAYALEIPSNSRPRLSREAETTWGTPRVPFVDLIDFALAGKSAKVMDRVDNADGTTTMVFNVKETAAANTKLAAIRKRFKDWIWEDEDRKKELTDRYNDMFNSSVSAEYDVSFMLDESGRGSIPGMNPDWKLQRHQMAAVFRAVIERRGLLAHEVGLGKTLSMIAAASELKRLGIARKPAIAVPKKVITAFVNTVQTVFPLLKVHVIDSRDAARRNISMSQTATSDFDLVLMTHDNLDMLKMKPEFEAEQLRIELDEVNAVYDMLRAEAGTSASRGARIMSQIQKRREKLEAKIQDALQSKRKDDTISFEDTGIDFLFVDEFHKYKSLPVVTALGQVKGVPTGDSQRALNMLMRTRYLRSIQNGGGIIAATGTPVSNTLVEAWIMSKFLQPDLLEESGVQSFDAWVRNFAETVPALEMGATGEWKNISRLSKFRNLPELQVMSRMTLDVKTAKETGVLEVRPKRIDKVIEVPQTKAQKLFMRVLRERARAVQGGQDPRIDNFLVISSDGMLMASDPRLVLPGWKEEGHKIKALVENVLRVAKAKPGQTQMIFSDTGVSQTVWGFSLYEEIIRKLGEGGIPAEKIINFSKLDTDKKVENAIARLNSGDALVAIGHRENMGTGVNAQTLMAAIHQFDVPWKPSLVEQSEARGWRQGNKNAEIEILSYVTEGSFDAVKWSAVARKQEAIRSFMAKPQLNASREMEDSDDDALSYSQIAAAASGDPDYLRKAELDAKVFKLAMAKQSHDSDITNRKQAIPRIKDNIEAYKRKIIKVRKEAAIVAEIQKREPVYRNDKGDIIEDRKDAAKNLVSAYLFSKDKHEHTRLGTYKNEAVWGDGWGHMYLRIEFGQGESLRINVNVNTEEFVGTMQSMDRQLAGAASASDADYIEQTLIPSLEKDLAVLEQVVDTVFPYDAQLQKAERQLRAINRRLKAKEQSEGGGEPVVANGLDVRQVAQLGRYVRRGVREKTLKLEEMPAYIEKELKGIEESAADQMDVWREFQRRTAEEFLLEHDNDTGLAGMAITAASITREQANYDPELDEVQRTGPPASLGRTTVYGRTREGVDVVLADNLNRAEANAMVAKLEEETRQKLFVEKRLPDHSYTQFFVGPTPGRKRIADARVIGQQSSEPGPLAKKGPAASLGADANTFKALSQEARTAIKQAEKLYEQREELEDKYDDPQASAEFLVESGLIEEKANRIVVPAYRKITIQLAEIRAEMQRVEEEDFGVEELEYEVESITEELSEEGTDAELEQKLKQAKNDLAAAKVREKESVKQFESLEKLEDKISSLKNELEELIAFEQSSALQKLQTETDTAHGRWMRNEISYKEYEPVAERFNTLHQAELDRFVSRMLPSPAASMGQPKARDLADPMDTLLYQQTIIKTRGSRGVRMYVNDHARAIIGAALTDMFQREYTTINAVNLSRQEAYQLASYLDREAGGLTGDHRKGAEKLAANIRQMVDKSKGQRTFNVVDITPFEERHQAQIPSDRRDAVEGFKGTIREETFHWAQRKVDGQSIALVGSSWAQSSKGYGKYRKALVERGYPDDPETLAAEIAAKIAAGLYSELGIRTEADHQQAAEWLASYFEKVAEKHGVDALNKFDRLLQPAKEAKLNAKERLAERIRQEREAKETGTNRPRAPGDGSKRVRRSDEGGQENGKEEVQRADIDAPFEGGEKISGPQQVLPGGINRQNVRAPGEAAPEADIAGGGKPPRGPQRLFDGREGPEPNEPGEWSREPEQAVMFDNKGLPRGKWARFWGNVGDLYHAPRSFMASADLSASMRQGFYMSVPPSQWGVASKAMGRQVKSLVSQSQYDQFVKNLKRDKSFKEAHAAGLYFASEDSKGTPLSEREEQFISRFAGKLPWVKLSERAYKTYLDSLRMDTFNKYKRAIDKQFKNPKERFEGYQAAAEWINTSTGRGRFRGKFGEMADNSMPFLNTFFFAPRYVISRIQMLNPRTYAENLKNPQTRVVFRRQMAELFQVGGVLAVTGALALASGATISFDPDDADFLKLRFGTTRYDVLAGLQQVARLGLRIGEWMKAEFTEDDEKQMGKIRNATGEAVKRFGRTKLGPVPGFFVDWMNNWRSVTGEQHKPFAGVKDLREGETAKGIAEITKDPVLSKVMPILWADFVDAWATGWREGGAENANLRAAKQIPAVFGLGVQDYDRPEYSKPVRHKLAEFDLDPGFPDRKPDEDERAYQRRVKDHISNQERAINRFSDDPNMAGQPKERLKALLKQEISKDGIERLARIPDEDVQDDRMVRAWIQVGLERLKGNAQFQQLSEYEQEKAISSYYGRMNRFRAQIENSKRDYQPPDVVDNEVLEEQIYRSLNRNN